MTRVLIVEDNETLRIGMRETLEGAEFEVLDAADGGRALELVDAGGVDVVVTDLKMAPVDGLTVLREVKSRHPDVEVVMITAFGTIETAVEAMKGGAFDFITKPFSPETLEMKVRHVAKTIDERSRRERAEAETAYHREQEDRHFRVDEIVGQSQVMVRIFDQIRKIARADAAVLIAGESGTGKELVARAIHRNSARGDAAFITVNCGALAEGVLESELFGHEKGAFTGAVRMRRGRFELADGGTIFLDEVAEVSLSTQVKLLRVLQEKSFERVGGERTLKVDVRVLAASNRKLQEEVVKGTFREDLFYRLHVIPIELPPLRERPEDIRVLAKYFLDRMAAERGVPAMRLTRDAEEMLVSYHWPGNVRELENIMERALVLSDSSEIGADDLPVFSQGATANVLSLPEGDPPLNDTLASLERQLILRALARADGVKAEAARRLGIKESALYYKLEKYGISG